MLRKIDASRVASAKVSYTTRRVDLSDIRCLIVGDTVRPTAGDVVLARVDALGKHTRLELSDGRRAHLFPGDEIIVAFGNRYAPDQFEARIGDDLSACNLVAAGGIAGVEVARHERVLPATQITPVGLAATADGQALNLSHYALPERPDVESIPAILCFGTSMNAGKTLAATSIVRGFKRLGYRVAALKITGTGAGGDIWITRDAGADVAADFTDAGMASTYLADIPQIENACRRLLAHAAEANCDVAVIEVADGLQQVETARLVKSRQLNEVAIGSVFAAYDSMGAKQGVDFLCAAGHRILGLSGKIGRSPLGVREAEGATGLRVFAPTELQNGALIPRIREEAAALFVASGYRRRELWPFAKEALPRMQHDVRRTYVEVDRCGDLAVLKSALRVEGRGAVDGLMKAVLQDVAQYLMSEEADAACGARFGARSRDRTDRRSGYRIQTWSTPFGPIDLRVPRLRHGRLAPACLATTPDAGFVEAVIEHSATPAFGTAVARLAASLGTSDLSKSQRMHLESVVFAAMASGGGAMTPSEFGHRGPDPGLTFAIPSSGPAAMPCSDHGAYANGQAEPFDLDCDPDEEDDLRDDVAAWLGSTMAN